MGVEGVLQNISIEQKRIASLTEIERLIVFDVGLLTAWDLETISMPAGKEAKGSQKREEYSRQLARDNAQVVLDRLHSMQDTEIVDGESVLNLPEPTTVLPRAKAVPTPKPPTKWEQFARRKGIKSKSSKQREKLNWDDSTRKWVPRYGYRKAKNEEEKNWIAEIPDQADLYADYFGELKEEKKERIAKNKFQQMRNKLR